MPASNMHTLVWALVASLASPASAFVRMQCQSRLVRERADPIVNPGGISGHVHAISGGNAFGLNMTYEQARAATCSSCQIKEDMSNYWTPQLYVQKKDGTYEPVPVAGDGDDSMGGMTVYYLQRGDDPSVLKPFPPDFRMLAGDIKKRTFGGDLASKAVNFACLGSNQPETNNLPNYECPDGLRAQIFFPSCWDGVNTDSSDHRSHMAYPTGDHYDNGPCPATHPVHLVSIFFEVLYDTKKFSSEWVNGESPFVFANGDKTGYSFHGDFVNGWDIPTLQNLITTCTNPDDQGVPDKCGAITLYTMAEQQSCKIEPVINEKVEGVLTELPGCVTVDGLAAPADAGSCPVPAVGAFASYYTDLTSKGFAFEGCYSDGMGGRTLTGASTTDATGMTVEKCLDFCSGKGFEFAGVEFSTECYCGASVPADRAPAAGTTRGKCTMKCAGNADEFCGGSQALSVYRKCAAGSECLNNAALPVSSGGNGTVPITAPTLATSAASSSATPIMISSSAAQSSAVAPTATMAPTSTPVVGAGSGSGAGASYSASATGTPVQSVGATSSAASASTSTAAAAVKPKPSSCRSKRRRGVQSHRIGRVPLSS